MNELWQEPFGADAELSKAPWTWINTSNPEWATLARLALAKPHCNAVILSPNPADGSFLNLMLALRDEGV